LRSRRLHGLARLTSERYGQQRRRRQQRRLVAQVSAREPYRFAQGLPVTGHRRRIAAPRETGGPQSEGNGRVRQPRTRHFRGPFVRGQVPFARVLQSGYQQVQQEEKTRYQSAADIERDATLFVGERLG